ncbi:hypothetical protein [Bacillus massilinigeriensis]|uniref:hypothetical protein n=1 Tax=Bacillus mediterraneensis TaxID=1805474 RepID=UPI0008F8E754|nr:hypothetical protein [Bacillus mediterraneensis]
MKKSLLFVFLPFLLLTFFCMTGVNAISALEEPKLLFKKQGDVTGDKKKDTILLKGIPHEKDSAYLKAVLLETITSQGKKITVKLPGGYEPTLSLKDMDHDGVKDLFVSIPTGGSGGLANYFLYTLKDGSAKNITIPETLQISSQFEDNYKASIKIDQTGKKFTVDLSSRKKEYERLGIYQDGKLNEPTELIVQPFGLLKPVKLQNGRYGFKGLQQISGAYRADVIATAVSLWEYKNGEWVLSKSYLKRKGKH